eukprot:206403-Prorocentrum_minimum.AAC.1
MFNRILFQHLSHHHIVSLPLCDWCRLRVYSLSPSVICARYGSCRTITHRGGRVTTTTSVTTTTATTSTTCAYRSIRTGNDPHRAPRCTVAPGWCPRIGPARPAPPPAGA